MTQKDKLLDFLNPRLVSYYEKVRLTGKADDSETKYINGIMASIRVLEFADKEELEELIKAAHLNVFDMSYEERKMEQALIEGGDHWDIFEAPTIRRRNK